MTEETPQRAKLECDHCGSDADSTLGGEHIHKCSEVIEKDELRELVEEWRRQAKGNNHMLGCADELEQLIEDHE